MPTRASVVRCCVGILLHALVVCAVSNEAIAQQTIINVPSDDLTPKGQHFYLFESAILPKKKGQEFGTTNYYTYGLTSHTELAATLYNFNSGRSENMTLSLGFKSVFHVLDKLAPDLEAKATFGHMTPISLKPNSQAVGFFTYGSFSFDVPRTDLRLLGGVAGGSRNLLGVDALSFIGGAEYPFTDHLSFTGEWYSGNNNFSGLIPGLTYHRNEWLLVAGYKIPNDFDRKSYGVVLEVGRFFGGKKEPENDHAEPGDAKHYGERLPRRSRLGNARQTLSGLFSQPD